LQLIFLHFRPYGNCLFQGVAPQFLINPGMKTNRPLLATIISLFAGLLFLNACDTTSSTNFEPVTISGLVTDAADNPLSDAIVRITSPQPERVTVTDAQGSYAFEIEVDSTTSFNIEAQKEGFSPSTQQFLTIPERDVTVPVFKLNRAGTTTDPDDPNPPPGEDPDPEDPPPFTEPASIYLLGATLTEIGVRETGQQEDTKLTFQIVDVNGNPLGAHNPVDVTFRFGARPDGGETLTDESITTNEDGQASATLMSGTRSGVVQVVAETQTTGGTLIRSNPVAVVIHAGQPSQQHFSLLTETRNAPFGVGANVNWTVMVGDRYGNTVPDGTAIYFTTEGGFIQGAGFTTNGRASAQLQVGQPFPAGGIATITASTVNDQNETISTSGNMIFSLAPIITVNPTTFNIPNGGDQQFSYTVMDSQGNPMVEDTGVTVTVEGEAADVLGDVNITVGGLNSGFTNIPQLTQYSFTVNDGDGDVDEDTPVQITIESTGPNGDARLVLNGRKAKLPTGN